ncbi:SpoIIIAH-like family protein [Alicyclobacillus tolerans]|uniref:SpoIIIAH-like family protein n=1 Tax=Alicyclobacillus tolerans TaxID=90970 RepID=UPI001F2F074F|nr:SpoIIIAH-like family protein [Alicyclobacillus tolerans]MCF8563590.1 SpoIIIAH-like family protein [Alicyclobacillus tolerans]
MVKRQTVWLSTMMVLSLMLIGYYTMNNGVQTTTQTDNTTQVTTAPGSSASTASTANSTGSSASTPSSNTASSSSSAANSTPNPASTSTAGTSATDWFAQTQTQITQELSRQEDVYSQIIASNNSSAAQVSQAETQLKQLETLIGELGNARDAVLGEGYQQCVIVPNLKSNEATVYVKAASKLSPADAVKIMNVVSQNLNIPINNVVVDNHA